MLERIAILLKEPSTLAGLGTMLAGFGVFSFSPEQWGEILGVLAMILGAIAAGKRDSADKS